VYGEVRGIGPPCAISAHTEKVLTIFLNLPPMGSHLGGEDSLGYVYPSLEQYLLDLPMASVKDDST